MLQGALIGVLVWVGLSLTPSMAQVSRERIGEVRNGNAASPTARTSQPPRPRRGVTARLLRRPIYRRIVQKIDQLRHTGRPQQRVAPERGDRQTFYVRDVQNLSQWNEVEAELLHRSAQVQFWMQEKEVEALRNRGLLRALIDSLVRRTVRRTPAGSVDRSRGILQLERDYFGASTNVDGDGRTDVLLLDIEDRFEQTGSYVAGFFDPNDLTTNEYSNRRDLMYVDTRPTILQGENAEEIHLQRAAATIAHEYQHLIHAGYEGEPRERTFVNEGVSEFAEILCGFPPRPARAYLGAPGRPLMSWNYDDPLPDYARASLFTHYFFEQIGFEWADELVQNEEVGLDGFQTVLHRAGGPSFHTLFRNWGRALLLNDGSGNPAYGYRHPDRQDLHFEKTGTVEGLPGQVAQSTGALSHTLFRIPLVDRVSVQAHSPATLRYDASITYPDAPNTFRVGVEEGEPIEAKAAQHGSVRLLASNLSVAADSERVEAQFLARGRRSAQRQALRYGDGMPDAYSGNASYLLLEAPGEAVGVTFGPPASAWLHAAAVDAVFRSELAGADVPSDAPRRLTLQVRALEKGRPGEALTPPLTRTVDRSFGNLRLEPVSLLRQYEALSALRDSFVVLLSSARPAQNPLAVGMDRAAPPDSAGSAFHRASSDATWRRLRTVQAEGRSLAGYRPLIHARVAVPERRISPSTLGFDTAYEAERAYVRLRAPFILDSTRTHLFSRVPSGALVEGTPVADSADDVPLRGRSPREAVYRFPSQTGAEYEIFARAKAGPRTVARGTVSWRIPDAAAVQLGTPAPNPSAGDVHLPITVLDASRVQITVYDGLGRVVQRLDPRRVESGTHRLALNLRRLSSGVYFARVKTRRRRDGRVAAKTRKLVRVR